jgi:hypothetical protein
MHQGLGDMENAWKYHFEFQIKSTMTTHVSAALSKFDSDRTLSKDDNVERKKP